jgi:hypothetical protein
VTGRGRCPRAERRVWTFGVIWARLLSRLAAASAGRTTIVVMADQCRVPRPAGQDLSGAGPFGQPLEIGDAVGRAPLDGQDEQGLPVRSAEHQRKRCPVLGKFDALQDFAALGDADRRVPGRADPDRTLGVQADAVRAEAVGEDPPVGQPSVGVDIERGQPARERLGDDQRPVIGVMTMPLGNWMSSATWRSSPSGVTSLIQPGLGASPPTKSKSAPLR